MASARKAETKESSSVGRNYRLAVTTTGNLELQWKNGAGSTQLTVSPVRRWQADPQVQVRGMRLHQVA